MNYCSIIKQQIREKPFHRQVWTVSGWNADFSLVNSSETNGPSTTKPKDLWSRCFQSGVGGFGFGVKHYVEPHEAPAHPPSPPRLLGLTSVLQPDHRLVPFVSVRQKSAAVLESWSRLVWICKLHRVINVSVFQLNWVKIWLSIKD